jgi:hypothetical protein
MDEEEYMEKELKKEEKKIDEEREINSNILGKIGNEKEKITSGVKGFFIAVWDLKLIIFVQLFSLIIIGLDKFLTASWSWDVFKDPDFWNSYILYFIANWSVIIVWIIRKLTILKRNSKKYKTNNEKIQDSIDKDYDDPFIETQANLEDTMRKIEIFNNTIYTKLYKLSLKYHIRDLREFYRQYDKYTIMLLKPYKGRKKLAWAKKYEKAHKKMLDLMENLKKEWQKQNLSSQRLEYPRVTRSHIVSGLKPAGKFYRYNSYQTKVFSTTAKTIVPSTVIFSLIGLVLLSFQFLTKRAELYDYLLFASQIFLITINVVLILSSLDTVFDRTYIKSTDERRTDIEKFYRRHTSGKDKYTVQEKQALDIIDYQEKGYEFKEEKVEEE